MMMEDEKGPMLFSDAERWWIVGSVLIVEIATGVSSILLFIFDKDPFWKLLGCYGFCLIFIAIVCSIIYFVARKREKENKNEKR